MQLSRILCQSWHVNNFNNTGGKAMMYCTQAWSDTMHSLPHCFVVETSNFSSQGNKQEINASHKSATNMEKNYAFIHPKHILSEGKLRDMKNTAVNK